MFDGPVMSAPRNVDAGERGVRRGDRELALGFRALALVPIDCTYMQTRAGYVVMRLIEIREGQARPLSEVRELVEQRVQAEHTMATRERILAALRRAAKIEYLQW